MTTAPTSPRWRRIDSIAVVAMTLGYGGIWTLYVVGGLLPPRINEVLAAVAAVAALGGMVFVGYRTYHLINRTAVQSLVDSRSELVTEYKDGLAALGMHLHILVYWEDPPRIILDGSFRERPLYRDFTIWHSKLCLRLIRRPSLRGRSTWLGLYAIGIGTGILLLYWVLFRRNRA